MTDKMLSEAEPKMRLTMQTLKDALECVETNQTELLYDDPDLLTDIIKLAMLAIPKPRQDAGRVEALEDEAQGMRFMAATLAEEIKRLNHINAMAWELGALEAVDIINHEDQEANWDRLNIAWQVNERLLKRLLADPAVDRTLAALTLEAKPQTDIGGLVEAVVKAAQELKEQGFLDDGIFCHEDGEDYELSEDFAPLNEALDALAQADAKEGKP